MAAILGRGHLLVVAAAGYGKTMALQEGIERAGLTPAWVPCGESSRDPGRLVGEVIDAVGRAVPGATSVLAERLAGGVEPVAPEAALRALLEELDRLLVEPVALVLDDAEALAGRPDALGLVALLLGARSAALRVAVASRTELDLRLAKLRASGWVADLGAADLAFTPAECGELLALLRDGAPSADDVDAAMEATEGWPLGIALGAARAGGAGTGSRAEVSAFLAEEVLEPLDPARRRALLVSALPRELDAGVAAALGLPEDLLTGAAQAGPFLRPVDPAGQRHRYHPLVREFLLERLAAELPAAELGKLHARLAPALEAAELPEQAVEHWLAAERWEAAVTAIARTGRRLLGTAAPTVRGWLDRLPAEARRDPAIMLLEGRLEYGAGRHGAAAELLRATVAAHRERGDTEREWMARLALMDALHASGDFAEAVALTRGMDDPDAHALPTAPNVAVMAAMCLSHEGRFDEAADLNRRALEHPAGAASRPLSRALEGLFLDRPAGRLDDAVRKAREALRELDVRDPFDRGPFVRALLHLVLEEQGRDEEALAESLRAQRDATQIGVEGYLVAMLRAHSVGIHARAGRLDEARRELERAGGAEQGAGWRQIGVGRATLAAAEGDAEEAARRAEEALDKVGSGPFLQRIHAVAFLVPVLVAAGRPTRARAVLDATLEAWRPGYPRWRLLAQRAWLCRADGDDGWIDDLRAAWEQAGDQVPHLVRREWPRLHELVWEALVRDVLPPGETVAALEAAWPGSRELLPYLEHPVAAVRRAAVAPAATSGRPEVLRRLGEAVDDEDAGVAAAARSALDRVRREPPALRFRLLGRFELARGDWTTDPGDWQRPLAARLVRYLLVHRDTVVTEDELFDAFWPDSPADTARRSLQVTVSRARALLDVPGAERTVLEVADRGYRLALRPADRVDAEEFEAAAAGALTAQGPERLRALDRAVALWGGDPLPEERFADWAVSWREGLRDRFAEVLLALVHAHRDGGDGAARLRFARRLAELDPLDESAQRELMTAYAAAGRVGHALRQFLACRRALVDELGVEPSQRTLDLQAAILAGRSVR